MRYAVDFSMQEVEENHKIFLKRRQELKNAGFDFTEFEKALQERALPLKGDILEIGTGKGNTCLSLAKLGYEFTSIDKDKDALKIAALNLAYENLNHQVELFLMDAENLDFKSNSFDVVIAINVFHHIHNAEKVLREIDRVLRKAGKLIFADINENGAKRLSEHHNNEGRKHEHSGLEVNKINDLIKRFDYKLTIYSYPNHWLLIARKNENLS